MSARFDSQGFLGLHSEITLANARVGVVGVGGGGSHMIQQLAHIGVGTILVADPDVVEDRNLNRLVGAGWWDVGAKAPKVAVAERMTAHIRRESRLLPFQVAWQEAASNLRACHAIVGCVDSYRERDELEGFCRRFLIPYLDIGMDVFAFERGFTVSGQVILSLPGNPCLRCMGIVNDDLIGEEARRYGAAGSRPQVIWPNGVLASTAVGLLMQLLTPWDSRPIGSAYLEYDGNAHVVRPSQRLSAVATSSCLHYKLDEVGDPFFGRD